MKLKKKTKQFGRVQKYVPELKKIAKQHGGILRCEDVVSFAANPATTLHKWFEWDNGEAAHQWRLQQARGLIRVSVCLMPTTKVESRVFVSLHGDRKLDGGGYRPLKVVLENAELRATLLDEALEELEWFRRKYQCLKELSEIFVAFDRVKRRKVS